MKLRLDQNTFFQFLLDPAPRYRMARHGLLWSAMTLLMYERFRYNATLIDSAADRTAYVTLSTLIFVGLILLDYLLMAKLIRLFLFQHFRPLHFLAGLLGVHFLTVLLVRWHVVWFVHWFTLPRLPVAYQNFADHVMGLAVWQLPFDSVLVFIFCFSLVYTYLIYALSVKLFKDLVVQRTRGVHLEKENLRLEFDFLKAQVNPHFLFNTLNNIYSFSIQAPDRVPGTILKLAELMRYTLYQTEEPLVPLSRELSFLRTYVELQRIRHEADTPLSFEIHGTPGTLTIAPLLLIVFVENAFKHGPQASVQRGWVRIRTTVNNGQLRFEVSNSTHPTSERTEEPGGVGLANAQRRLDMLYPDRYQLTTKQEADSYHVLLLLDLHGKPIPGGHRG
jgi:two-component system, LytTR family, sensor kinase